MCWTLFINIEGLILYGADYLTWGTLPFTILILSVALNLVATILLFKKSNKTVLTICAFLVFSFFAEIYFTFSGMYEEPISLISEGIISGIWIGYFVNSKRVKNTLVN